MRLGRVDEADVMQGLAAENQVEQKKAEADGLRQSFVHCVGNS
jgi:hypothetical protein